MKKKAIRWDAIRMIVSSKEIGSQEELLQELRKEGVDVTQATLSRDLKQMKIVKTVNVYGTYSYVLPNSLLYKHFNDRSESEVLVVNGFISLHFSGNLAVIHTRPGCASSMAYEIDNRTFDGVLGTIAGDDTIMIVLSESVSHEEVRNFLAQIIPNLK